MPQKKLPFVEHSFVDGEKSNNTVLTNPYETRNTVVKKNPTSAIFIKCLLWKVNFRESKVIKYINIICVHWPAISNDYTASLGRAGIKIMSAHAFWAFLGQLRFWMGTIWVARWNGLEILIPKHMWKSKIRLLEQKLDVNR